MTVARSPSRVTRALPIMGRAPSICFLPMSLAFRDLLGLTIDKLAFQAVHGALVDHMEADPF